jgi:hypothetical protein
MGQVCLTRANFPLPYGVCTALHTVWFQNLAGWCPTLQIDPWVEAAECERVILVVADPERRSVFISLRSLWIALGNKETIFDESRQTGQAPMIAQYTPSRCLYTKTR